MTAPVGAEGPPRKLLPPCLGALSAPLFTTDVITSRVRLETLPHARGTLDMSRRPGQKAQL